MTMKLNLLPSICIIPRAITEMQFLLVECGGGEVFVLETLPGAAFLLPARWAALLSPCRGMWLARLLQEGC